LQIILHHQVMVRQRVVFPGQVRVVFLGQVRDLV
jgi:hypothetical protein